MATQMDLLNRLKRVTNDGAQFENMAPLERMAHVVRSAAVLAYIYNSSGEWPAERFRETIPELRAQALLLVKHAAAVVTRHHKEPWLALNITNLRDILDAQRNCWRLVCCLNDEQ